jgi:hypothetical protein
MEFLRIGSSIPGAYWGCCACDFIQNFKVDPDAPAAIEIVSGDGGGSTGKYAGPTWRDIFMQRIRFGTFGTRDMPNHGFIAILTDWQINSGHGAKWMAILKECGFEFIRSISNSVYSGATLAKHAPDSPGSSVNYVFALFRNIGNGNIGNPFQPPAEWLALEQKAPEIWDILTAEATVELAAKQHEANTAIWNSIGPAKLLTREECEAKGLNDDTIWMAGRRSHTGGTGGDHQIGYPQQTTTARKKYKEQAGVKDAPAASLRASPTATAG